MTMQFILLLIITNPPIERIGELCPTGYWRSSSYCIPCLDLLSAIKRFLTLLVVNALWVSIAVVDIASAHVDGCA